MLRHAALSLLCATFIATGVRAQSLPDGWEWRPQAVGPVAAAADSGWSFDRMPPGWHITTGPAVLLFPTAATASVPFTLTADFVVFPSTTDSGFGLFVGGAGLEGSQPAYLAALLRRDGSLSVVRRVGADETVLLPWTHHPASHAHPGSGTVTNRLRLQATPDSLQVMVNDSTVARLAMSGEWTHGAFGLSAGAGVNLHITILDHTRHLAPLRVRESRE